MIKGFRHYKPIFFFMRDIYEAVITLDAADTLQNKFFVVI